MGIGLRVAGMGEPIDHVTTPVTYRGVTISTFPQASPNGLYILSSVDGKNFTAPAGVSNPVFGFPSTGGSGSSSGTQASSVIFDGVTYWVAYEFNNLSGSNNKFGIAKASSLAGPWTWVTDVTAVATTSTSTNVWNPRWFIDDDDSVHILVNVESGVTYDTAFHPVMLDTVDPTFVSWSGPTLISGTFPSDMIDTFMMSPNNSPNGLYNIWFKQEGIPGSLFIGYMSSSSLKTGYSVTQSGNWAGWGQAEGPMVDHIAGSHWRMYLISPIAGAMNYSDSFDNWATWTAITPIGAPFVNPGTGSIIYRVL